jgi:hypothetical protein
MPLDTPVGNSWNEQGRVMGAEDLVAITHVDYVMSGGKNRECCLPLVGTTLAQEKNA